jgi:hypothetical protein
MLTRCITFAVVAVACIGATSLAAAQHERYYEFDDTHIAISIERFMGIDYTDYEAGDGDVSARLLLNASEPTPTNYARLGFDVFIERLSIGIAGGVTTEDVAVLAPRVGYMFGLTPNLGLWLRGGVFFATIPQEDYLGVYGEALFSWFPYPWFAFTFGPTLDVAFADDDPPLGPGDYISLGIPEVGMTVLF